MALTVARPDESEYGPEFGNYIRLTPDGDLLEILDSQVSELQGRVGRLSEEESLVCHPPFTWTIKQVIGHVIDCERIFGYRALRVARGDATPLPGFDENEYMRAVDFNRYPLPELVDEFASLRRSHVLMLRHLDAGAWLRRGTVRGGPMSARAMAYAMAGHAKHHLDILRRRLSSA